MFPLTGGIPESPLSPVPRNRWNSTVSALSSMWCATAMRLRPYFSAVSSRWRYLKWRPASSSDIPCSCAQALTSSFTAVYGIINFSQRSPAAFSSLSASAPRSPWFK